MHALQLEAGGRVGAGKWLRSRRKRDARLRVFFSNHPPTTHVPTHPSAMSAVVRKPAPDFSGEAVDGSVFKDIKLSDYKVRLPRGTRLPGFRSGSVCWLFEKELPRRARLAAGHRCAPRAAVQACRVLIGARQCACHSLPRAVCRDRAAVGHSMPPCCVAPTHSAPTFRRRGARQASCLLPGGL